MTQEKCQEIRAEKYVTVVGIKGRDLFPATAKYPLIRVTNDPGSYKKRGKAGNVKSSVRAEPKPIEIKRTVGAECTVRCNELTGGVITRLGLCLDHRTRC